MNQPANITKESEALRTAVAQATWHNEDDLRKRLTDYLALDDADWAEISDRSAQLIDHLRSADKQPLIDQFLTEYGLSNNEGVQLMRLAEALSRTADPITTDELIRDKIAAQDWLSHARTADGFLLKLSAHALHLTDKWISWSGRHNGALLKPVVGLSNVVIRISTRAAIKMLSSQFVFAETLDGALARAKKYGRNGYLFSFDMLGEAARTKTDAQKYYKAYADALDKVAQNAGSEDPRKNHGISIKLSALHPRYEYGQADQVVPELVGLLLPLAVRARDANIQITIDAEEAERLEISMDVLAGLIARPELEGWRGLGFVVQAYQRRAMPLIEWLGSQTQKLGAPLFIRLVKGAYWDSEIKRAQEMGLESYPVFTRKEMTDLSYLACAKKLLAHPESFSPQFATHNAHSIAAIQHLATGRDEIEFQRLFGMGQQLHDRILTEDNVTSRIYAPVGTQKDLLSYLIRRLLENGANSSFVHKLADKTVDSALLTKDPVSALSQFSHTENANIPSPRSYLGSERVSATGWDLSNPDIRKKFDRGLRETAKIDFVAGAIIAGEQHLENAQPVHNPADHDHVVGECALADGNIAETAIETADQAFAHWSNQSATERADILKKAADLLEQRASTFHYLAIKEAGKSWTDAVDELREAVDFCRYYAARCVDPDFQRREALGVVVCISPWNFPLAIFLGQVTAALAAGNSVIAKPAEPTPLIAAEAIRLLHDAGVDKGAVNLVPGPGRIVGEALISHPKTAAVCFTGSTATAKRIVKNLAEQGRSQTPLIAETGGLNAMIVDSSALLEQTVDAVVSSAFQSAGQRCSALRILCVQDDIADEFVKLLGGAMDALRVGDPARLETDVGPVIDKGAKENIERNILRLKDTAHKIGETRCDDLPNGHFIEPIAFELNEFEELKEEIFGPVLHLVRFKAQDKMAMVEKINQSGYGLTLGIQSRIDHICDDIAERASVGNIYINRNQIGAVVGVQPFGGHGLSGTGPKAGGPLYLKRLSRAPLEDVDQKQSLDSLRGALPSPAGETNDYVLEPRGRILAIITAEDPNGDKALELGRAAGNKMLPLSDQMDPATALSNPRFDAILLSRNHPQSTEIGKAIANREGMIIPVIYTDDSIDRFVNEKTITNNIAAAGGDVSLLNA